ncbi:helicase-related protein [Streptomyces sp. SBT349]|uniref:helicase-related protein n=1 Tax=Streptomyces sp. SBT349 TaxID=1580539 RepID=UPI000AFD1D30|nr:helicase-related protein [Streptomyces sp. SBT349]
MPDGEGALPKAGSQIMIDGHLVTVVMATETASGCDLVIRHGDGRLADAALTHEDLCEAVVPANDAGGNPDRALAGLWGRWMQYAVPRIRSAVLATRPLKPYAHQDEAVFTHMLAQPRLRFLLADEPGTGKTIMTGMYIAEGTRRGLIPGRTIVVVPAHLVSKWQRDLRRYFAIEAGRLTPEIARDPKDLDPRVSVWVVSVDLYTYNADVFRKVSGSRASWSLAVFDEAHRLTPTSRYLGAARELSRRTHHLLLLTATPHRGKEHFFRGLMNLLDPTLYPWDPRASEYDSALRPSTLSFLRRMKEELKDLEGNLLFPPRFAKTVPVDLSAQEQAAYTAVMEYVDTFYEDAAMLARSIYGKRAASSLGAAAATVRRRHTVLRGPASERSSGSIPEEFTTGAEGRLNLAVDDEDAWDRAEELVVGARTQDKAKELARIDGVLAAIAEAERAGPSTKWLRTQHILGKHGIVPGTGQLLVFTEFADTARWLTAQFAEASFSVDTLEGSVGHLERDKLQQRFLSGMFQVLISTDAGGEGIDLQSAHVMINWDIPWSLVRLEQRMGRLHRIGQTNPVHIYHLVAPQTREGRVQEVMLANIEAAGEALEGRIFDLLDAAAARSGFDYAQALTTAQDDPRQPVHVPQAHTLLASARELVRDENRLITPANVDAAMARFRADRLEAINPVIVDAFLDQLARAQGWALITGPAPGLRLLTSRSPLPEALGGGHERLVAADGASVRLAINDGATDLDDVIVLGPTEEPFGELVELALRSGEMDLVRGAHVVDTASLTAYVLLLYDAEVEVHDGVRRVREKSPMLVRFSGAGAFAAGWESLMNLRAAPSTSSSAATLTPAMRSEGAREAQALLDAETARFRNQRRSWVVKASEQLDQVEYRYLEELEELSADVRRERMDQFAQHKKERLIQLGQIEKVNPTAQRLVGWLHVAAGARMAELGYDPNSEQVAIATVLAELERLGYVVDDRQTAGVGYDLLARHSQRGEQRLIEVKGLVDDLRPVWLEQHEWAQAQQRGPDYWLYVVTGCATHPVVTIRAQDPAGKLGSAVRRIERVQIKVTDLMRMMESSRERH